MPAQAHFSLIPDYVAVSGLGLLLSGLPCCGRQRPYTMCQNKRFFLKNVFLCILPQEKQPRQHYPLPTIFRTRAAAPATVQRKWSKAFPQHPLNAGFPLHPVPPVRTGEPAACAAEKGSSERYSSIPIPVTRRLAEGGGSSGFLPQLASSE